MPINKTTRNTAIAVAAASALAISAPKNAEAGVSIRIGLPLPVPIVQVAVPAPQTVYVAPVQQVYGPAIVVAPAPELFWIDRFGCRHYYNRHLRRW